MGNLGSFGTARPAVDETFLYFGKIVRVQPDLTDLALVDLAKQASSMQGLTEGQGEEAIDMIAGLAGMIVHDDDADLFWRTARANRQTLEDVVGLAAELIGAMAGRPTVRPADSSDGQARTSAKSTADSSTQALCLLERRPDLAQPLHRNQMERAERAAV